MMSTSMFVVFFCREECSSDISMREHVYRHVMESTALPCRFKSLLTVRTPLFWKFQHFEKKHMRFVVQGCSIDFK